MTVIASKALAKPAKVATLPRAKKASTQAVKALKPIKGGNVATRTVRAFVIPGNVATQAREKSTEPTGNVATPEVRYLPTFVPTTEAEMAAFLLDPVWRICSARHCAFQVVVSSLQAAPQGEQYKLNADAKRMA